MTGKPGRSGARIGNQNRAGRRCRNIQTGIAAIIASHIAKRYTSYASFCDATGIKYDDLMTFLSSNNPTYRNVMRFVDALGLKMYLGTDKQSKESVDA